MFFCIQIRINQRVVIFEFVILRILSMINLRSPFVRPIVSVDIPTLSVQANPTAIRRMNPSSKVVQIIIGMGSDMVSTSEIGK